MKVAKQLELTLKYLLEYIPGGVHGRAGTMSKRLDSYSCSYILPSPKTHSGHLIQVPAQWIVEGERPREPDMATWSGKLWEERPKERGPRPMADASGVTP